MLEKCYKNVKKLCFLYELFYNHCKQITGTVTDRFWDAQFINKGEFFEVIDSCKGKVELVTGEGDRLNLKSKLSQYVSMANIFSDGTISELELLAYEPEDIQKLLSFMMS